MVAAVKEILRRHQNMVAAVLAFCMAAYTSFGMAPNSEGREVHLTYSLLYPASFFLSRHHLPGLAFSKFRVGNMR